MVKTNIDIQTQYDELRQTLNEKQWRHYLALEVRRRGNLAHVAREARVSRNTIRRGLVELIQGDHYTPGSRIRAAGGGRRATTTLDPSLLADLEALADPKGDPMSILKWTTKSLLHLEAALTTLGHTVSDRTVGRLLKAQHYSLRANRKTIEGGTHPDRDQQFQHIKETVTAFLRRGSPVISTDCKKKELLGNFKNNGREWTLRGTTTDVNVYDFESLGDGKAIPYGIYDLVHNQGFVNVGIDHDTAEFSVESIRRWWQQVGQQLYPGAEELLITCDGGGSNSAVARLWKYCLQQFANETGLTITVRHFPPGTSKWNKIEHRLFSYISINWRGKPLHSLETVIELISHTTTKAGLSVQAIKDERSYPTGQGAQLTKEQYEAINLTRDSVFGKWNYTIAPQRAGL
jgi:hypothetical protein